MFKFGIMIFPQCSARRASTRFQIVSSLSILWTATWKGSRTSSAIPYFSVLLLFSVLLVLSHRWVLVKSTRASATAPWRVTQGNALRVSRTNLPLTTLSLLNSKMTMTAYNRYRWTLAQRPRIYQQPSDCSSRL